MTLHSLYAYGARKLTDVIPPGVQFTRFAKYADARWAKRDRALLIAAGFLAEMPDGSSYSSDSRTRRT